MNDLQSSQLRNFNAKVISFDNFEVRKREYNLLQADVAYHHSLLTTLTASGNKGAIDCSTNPNYPAAAANQYYYVSVAGKIGGAAGPDVEVGDMIMALTTVASGDHATVGANWLIIQKNMMPTTATIMRTGTDNSQFVTAKTFADLSISFSATTGNLTVTRDVPDASTIAFNAIQTKTVAFTAGKYFASYNSTLTNNAADANNSSYTGYATTLTGIAAAESTLRGINIVIAGTLSGANPTNNAGLWFAPTCTLNHAAVNLYGVNLDFTGMTNTLSGDVYGLRIVSNANLDAAAYFTDGTRSVYLCDNAYAIWVNGGITSHTGTHMVITTQSEDYTIRLNSKNYTLTAGDIIGFQSKPRSNADGTQTVYGGQLSPGFNDGIDGASLVGLQIEPLLKGNTAAALTGDVRGIDVRLSADGTGHTVAGATSGIHFYNLLKASTFTGGVHCMTIENHGDTQAWTSFANFKAALGTNSCTTATDKTANAKSGTIIVYVDGTPYHIQLYANA